MHVVIFFTYPLWGISFIFLLIRCQARLLRSSIENNPPRLLTTSESLELSDWRGHRELSIPIPDYSYSVHNYTRLTASVNDDQIFGIAVDSSLNFYVVGHTHRSFDSKINAGGSDIVVMKYSSSNSRTWILMIGSTSFDYGRGIVVDASSNSYIIGYTAGSINSQTNNGGFDILIMKIGSSGSTLWTKIVGSSADDYGQAIALDSAYNVYVVGSTYGAFHSNTNAGSADIVLMKYDTAGNWIWTNIFGSTSADFGMGIAVDSSASNVYISGYTSGSIDGQTYQGGKDAVVMQLSSATGAVLWTKQFGSSSDEAFNSLAVAAGSAVYVTGYTTGSFNGTTSSGDKDIWTLKLSLSGGILWSRIIGSSYEDAGMAITMDSSNSNIYVSGYSFGSFGTYVNVGGSDLVLLRYTSKGTLMWASSIGSVNNDAGLCVASDYVDNAYIAGYVGGTSTAATITGPDPHFFFSRYLSTGSRSIATGISSTTTDTFYSVVRDGNGNMYAVGSSFRNVDGEVGMGSADILIVKYDSMGKKLWTRLIGSSNSDEAYAAALDSSGNLYVTGSAQGSVNSQSFSGSDDVITLRISSSGTVDWTQMIGSSSSESGRDICVDSANGFVYVTGQTSAGFDGLASSSTDIFIIKYSTTGVKQFTRLTQDSGTDSGYGIVLDVASQVLYVVGRSSSGFGGVSSPGGVDLVVVKYTTSGTKLWNALVGSSSTDYAQKAILDSSGNLVIVGACSGSIDGETFSGISDVLLVKYDPNGNRLVTRLYGSTAADVGNSIDIDSAGNIYITGYTAGSFDSESNNGANDIFVMKLDSSYNRIWTRIMGSTGADIGNDIMVNPNGDVYTVGYATSSINGETVTSGPDAFLIKLSPVPYSPTSQPSGQPSGQPSIQPSSRPTTQPTIQPSKAPTRKPSGNPTSQPSVTPSTQPSQQPISHPTLQPSTQPSSQPSQQPRSAPTGEPSTQPSRRPSGQPTCQPSSQPTNPTSQPSCRPSGQPSMQPSSSPTQNILTNKEWDIIKAQLDNQQLQYETLSNYTLYLQDTIARYHFYSTSNYSSFAVWLTSLNHTQQSHYLSLMLTLNNYLKNHAADIGMVQLQLENEGNYRISNDTYLLNSLEISEAHLRTIIRDVNSTLTRFMDSSLSSDSILTDMIHLINSSLIRQASVFHSHLTELIDIERYERINNYSVVYDMIVVTNRSSQYHIDKLYQEVHQSSILFEDSLILVNNTLNNIISNTFNFSKAHTLQVKRELQAVDSALWQSISLLNMSLLQDLHQLRLYVDASLPQVSDADLITLRDYLVDRVFMNLEREHQDRVSNDSSLASAIAASSNQSMLYTDKAVKSEADIRENEVSHVQGQLLVVNQTLQSLASVMYQVRDRIKNATFELSSEDLMAFSKTLFDDTMELISSIQQSMVYNDSVLLDKLLNLNQSMVSMDSVNRRMIASNDNSLRLSVNESLVRMQQGLELMDTSIIASLSSLNFTMGESFTSVYNTTHHHYLQLTALQERVKTAFSQLEILGPALQQLIATYESTGSPQSIQLTTAEQVASIPSPEAKKILEDNLSKLKAADSANIKSFKDFILILSAIGTIYSLWGYIEVPAKFIFNVASSDSAFRQTIQISMRAIKHWLHQTNIAPYTAGYLGPIGGTQVRWRYNLEYLVFLRMIENKERAEAVQVLLDVDVKKPFTLQDDFEKKNIKWKNFVARSVRHILYHTLDADDMNLSSPSSPSLASGLSEVMLKHRLWRQRQKVLFAFHECQRVPQCVALMGVVFCHDQLSWEEYSQFVGSTSTELYFSLFEDRQNTKSSSSSCHQAVRILQRLFDSSTNLATENVKFCLSNFLMLPIPLHDIIDAQFNRKREIRGPTFVQLLQRIDVSLQILYFLPSMVSDLYQLKSSYVDHKLLVLFHFLRASQNLLQQEDFNAEVMAALSWWVIFISQQNRLSSLEKSSQILQEFQLSSTDHMLLRNTIGWQELTRLVTLFQGQEVQGERNDLQQSMFLLFQQNSLILPQVMETIVFKMMLWSIQPHVSFPSIGDQFLINVFKVQNEADQFNDAAGQYLEESTFKNHFSHRLWNTRFGEKFVAKHNESFISFMKQLEQLLLEAFPIVSSWIQHAEFIHLYFIKGLKSSFLSMLEYSGSENTKNLKSNLQKVSSEWMLNLSIPGSHHSSKNNMHKMRQQSVNENILKFYLDRRGLIALHRWFVHIDTSHTLHALIQKPPIATMSEANELHVSSQPYPVHSADVLPAKTDKQADKTLKKKTGSKPMASKESKSTIEVPSSPMKLNQVQPVQVVHVPVTAVTIPSHRFSIDQDDDDSSLSDDSFLTFSSNSTTSASRRNSSPSLTMFENHRYNDRDENDQYRAVASVPMPSISSTTNNHTEKNTTKNGRYTENNNHNNRNRPKNRSIEDGKTS